MKQVLINEKFEMQFVVQLREYERTQVVLAKANQKFRFEDVTKENMGRDYPVNSERKEVIFWVQTTIKKAHHIQWLIN